MQWSPRRPIQSLLLYRRFSDRDPRQPPAFHREHGDSGAAPRELIQPAQLWALASTMGGRVRREHGRDLRGSVIDGRPADHRADQLRAAAHVSKKILERGPAKTPPTATPAGFLTASIAWSLPARVAASSVWWC